MVPSRCSELRWYGAGANQPSQELSVELHGVETTGRKQLWLAGPSLSFCWLDAGCLRGHLVLLRLAPRPRRGALQLRRRPAAIQKAPIASWGLTVHCAFFILRCVYYVMYINNKGEMGKRLVLKLNVLE